MPAGLEVTRSPPRPVAVTVRVAFWPGGVTVSVAVRVTLPALAVIVTGVDAVTELVVTVKPALVAPWATETLAGTLAVAGFELDSVTGNPPTGAAAVSVTVPWVALPPVTEAGLTDSADSAAGAGGDELDCGVKGRTEDQAPAVPIALIPRTRHQCRRMVRKKGAVNCDGVTSRASTGFAKSLPSSIWIRYDVAALTSVQSKATAWAGEASDAGRSSDGADGVGGGASDVAFSRTARPGKAPPMPSTRSGFVSALRAAVMSPTVPMLDLSGGISIWIGAWNVPF